MPPRIAVLAALFVCLVGALVAPAPASAQTEAVLLRIHRGLLENKALEIYNGNRRGREPGRRAYHPKFSTAHDLDVVVHSSGTVAAGDVYVVAQAAVGCDLAQGDQTNSADGSTVTTSWCCGRGHGHRRDRADRVDPGTQWGSDRTRRLTTLRRKAASSPADTNGSDAVESCRRVDGICGRHVRRSRLHSVEPPPPPPVITAAIWEIQAAGCRQHHAGTTRKTTGVVTACFPQCGRFFIRSAAGDGDAETSDGLLVHPPAPRRRWRSATTSTSSAAWWSSSDDRDQRHPGHG